MTAPNPLGLPLSKMGTTLRYLDLLAPGVLGYAMEDGDSIVIPFLEVPPSSRGRGHAGRFLDAVAASGGPYAIVNVTSRILEGALLRRGWVREDRVVEDPEDPFFRESFDRWTPPRRVPSV